MVIEEEMCLSNAEQQVPPPSVERHAFLEHCHEFRIFIPTDRHAELLFFLWLENLPVWKRAKRVSCKVTDRPYVAIPSTIQPSYLLCHQRSHYLLKTRWQVHSLGLTAEEQMFCVEGVPRELAWLPFRSWINSTTLNRRTSMMV
jgi:hypothetical protein